MVVEPEMDLEMEFTPEISSGWTEVEPGMELNPLHLRWDIYGTGDGVNPQKVE